jgi:magnesium transporter
MPRFIKDRSKAKGHAPGSLIFIGKQKVENISIHLMQYNEESFVELDFQDIEQAASAVRPGFVNWINIYGIHDPVLIKEIGKLFSLPQMLQEDMLNTDQFPKYEGGDEYDAMIVKMLHQKEKSLQINAEQISIVLGENYVLTLQEQPGDVFNSIRSRIRNKKGRIRTKGNDYLAYSLLDTIVENYSSLVELFGRQIEDLDDKIFVSHGQVLLNEIYKLKTELNFLRKSIRPFREIASQLLKSENSFFEAENKSYLTDLHGESHQTIENIEFYMNLLSDQLNVYNTSIQNKQNQVMKVLTIFASIFIPLTFLAGIYGMNFRYLPELEYKYSYPIFWAVSILIILSLLILFKRKKWL